MPPTQTSKIPTPEIQSSVLCHTIQPIRPEKITTE